MCCSHLTFYLHSWCVLVQDSTGGVCELQLSGNGQPKPEWQALLHGGEGQIYMFRGLRVLQRVNKDR